MNRIKAVCVIVGIGLAYFAAKFGYIHGAHQPFFYGGLTGAVLIIFFGTFADRILPKEYFSSRQAKDTTSALQEVTQTTQQPSNLDTQNSPHFEVLPGVFLKEHEALAAGFDISKLAPGNAPSVQGPSAKEQEGLPKPKAPTNVRLSEQIASEIPDPKSGEGASQVKQDDPDDSHVLDAILPSKGEVSVQNKQEMRAKLDEGKGVNHETKKLKKMLDDIPENKSKTPATKKNMHKAFHFVEDYEQSIGLSGDPERVESDLLQPTDEEINLHEYHTVEQKIEKMEELIRLLELASDREFIRQKHNHENGITAYLKGFIRDQRLIAKINRVQTRTSTILYLQDYMNKVLMPLQKGLSPRLEVVDIPDDKPPEATPAVEETTDQGDGEAQVEDGETTEGSEEQGEGEAVEEESQEESSEETNSPDVEEEQTEVEDENPIEEEQLDSSEEQVEATEEVGEDEPTQVGESDQEGEDGETKTIVIEKHIHHGDMQQPAAQGGSGTVAVETSPTMNDSSNSAIMQASGDADGSPVNAYKSDPNADVKQKVTDEAYKATVLGRQIELDDKIGSFIGMGPTPWDKKITAGIVKFVKSKKLDEFIILTSFQNVIFQEAMKFLPQVDEEDSILADNVINNVYEYIKIKKSCSTSDLCKQYKVKPTVAKRWAELLEKYGKVQVNYPIIGSPRIKLIEEAAAPAEEVAEGRSAEEQAKTEVKA